MCGPKSSGGYKTTAAPSPDGFAAVHVAPESSLMSPTAEPAGHRAAPAHVHDRRQAADSPAYRWATEVLERRGSGADPPQMLVFLAADAARYDELRFPIREYLAWKYVRDNADGVLNLTAQQRQQAVERLERADRTAKDRLLGAHHWALVPSQPDPTSAHAT